MSFHEVRFPANLSFGSVGGPERRTDVVTLANGFEERNTPWAHSRRRYDAGLGMRSLDDVEMLIAFFEARRGQMFGFRWKDWSDYKSCRASAEVTHGDQVIAEGDGARVAFPLVKTYRSGGFS
ncbi:TIGR02217 family protein, partial [Cribrihabitans sp. XS_ASV171]